MKRILIGALLGILTGAFIFLLVWEAINLTGGPIRGVYIGCYYSIIFGGLCGMLMALLIRVDFKKTIKILAMTILCGLLGLMISMSISYWLYEKYEKDPQTYADTFNAGMKGQPCRSYQRDYYRYTLGTAGRFVTWDENKR